MQDVIDPRQKNVHRIPPLSDFRVHLQGKKSRFQLRETYAEDG